MNNLSYELAKKLKDSGFPQTEDKYCHCGFLTDEQEVLALLYTALHEKD